MQLPAMRDQVCLSQDQADKQVALLVRGSAGPHFLGIIKA